jgi:hypothetical protein
MLKTKMPATEFQTLMERVSKLDQSEQQMKDIKLRSIKPIKQTKMIAIK